MKATRQNSSTAVMQRRSEPHKSLDDFPTPPWGTRILCEWLAQAEDLGAMSCREPAANRGHMVRPLREYFGSVEASDIFDYGAGFQVEDYLFGPDQPAVDWTITNPPFRLADQFIRRALRTSRRGVAVIARTAFLEGETRRRDLFEPHPPHTILQFTQRCPMFKGRIAHPSETSATAYCWIVWRSDRKVSQTRFKWLAPDRDKLIRPGDHPEKHKRSKADDVENQTRNLPERPRILDGLRP